MELFGFLAFKRTIYGHRPKTKEDTDVYATILREIINIKYFYLFSIYLHILKF